MNAIQNRNRKRIVHGGKLPFGEAGTKTATSTLLGKIILNAYPRVHSEAITTGWRAMTTG